ncbi:MAG: TRM11 family SAM-dependent methyltransferase [Culicoidibacterales bacterium]
MNTPTYLYFINYPDYEQELCELEQQYLFGSPQVSGQKYRFSNQKISPAMSPFLRERIEIVFQAASCAELVAVVQAANVTYHDFKIHYLRAEADPLAYRERLQACREVGAVIHGEANMQNPTIDLALTQIEGQWFLGLMEPFDASWQERTNKPHSYSNSLNNKVAKAAVNIAVSGLKNPYLVDPCCGVGTVVIEALAHGVAIEGYEINPLVAEKAQKNLAHFGFENVITCADMHTITKQYDVAIIDIPYGLYTPTTKQDQLEILKTAKRIAGKLILLTCDNLDELLLEAGFSQIETCAVNKNNYFTRYLCICQ